MVDWDGLGRGMITKSLGDLTKLSTSDRMIAAINEAAVDEKLWRTAIGDPAEFLLSRGVEIPPEISITFADGERDKPWPPPDPDLDLVVVRTFWWCYRDDTLDDSPGPRTCVRISLQVPRKAVRG